MKEQNTIEAPDKFGVWFDEFVSTLRSHQLQLETETASRELKAFYENVFSGNMDAMLKISKQASQQYFVKRIIVEYLEHLNKDLPKKLAFDFNDSEVLVWAEIEDNDEQMERNLILTEAAINAHYYEYGFAMTSTIVETEDQMAVPNHYKIYQA